MMKMQGGVHPDDLLIGLYVAREGKADLKGLLDILKREGTWEHVLSSGSVQRSPDTDVIFNGIATVGDEKSKAVEIVTDELLKEFFAIPDMEIADLRKEGANGREITLVYLLERYGKPKKKAMDILKMSTQQQKSWGEIANSFGLTPKETGKLIPKEG